MKVLQINTVANAGSTGKIAENIGKLLMSNGHESYIAYGRGNPESESKLIKIGTNLDNWEHGVQSYIFDRQGLGSSRATLRLIEQIDAIKPDVIGLHNLHGYYINVVHLFTYLKIKKTPVIWTFHDCWPFTGHCSHFDFIGCQKWQSHCGNCPLTNRYPKSYLLDRSHQNFIDKRAAFTGHPNLTIVTPSQWLANLVPNSFLREYPVKVLPNGVDINVFKPSGQPSAQKEKIILGVASVWDRIKGLPSFLHLRELLPQTYKIVLLGLSKKQQKQMPTGIIGLGRTNGVQELVDWYNKALVFVNPTYVDNFPTTNLESLACGTPVITYRTGGSPESLDENTGVVVPKGDVSKMAEAIINLSLLNQKELSIACRSRALMFFDMNTCFKNYLELYKAVFDQSKNGAKALKVE